MTDGGSDMDGASRPRAIRVLFVCTGNSARSQMAEALLRSVGGDRFEVISAGTRPSTVSPSTVRALAEFGIDASGARSKSVEEFVGGSFDWVVTVCDDARETCPFIPGARRMTHWSLEDPASAEGSEEERMATFRRVRDEIVARVRVFATDALEAGPA